MSTDRIRYTGRGKNPGGSGSNPCDDLCTCQKHKYGERHQNWTGYGVSPGGAHQRLRAIAGPAKDFPCVDGCGQPAYDWSQIKGTVGNRMSDYEPRCRSCHTKYDSSARPRNARNGRFVRNV